MAAIGRISAVVLQKALDMKFHKENWLLAFQVDVVELFAVRWQGGLKTWQRKESRSQNYRKLLLKEKMNTP